MEVLRGAEQASCIRQRPEGDEGTHSLVGNFPELKKEVSHCGSHLISNTVIKKQILNYIYLSENVQLLEQNINLQSYWKKEKKT